MNDKTKEHIETLYEAIKNEKKVSNSAFEIIKTQRNIIKLLEDDIKRLRHKLDSAIYKELEAKDYQYYKVGMVKIVKSKDEEINKLENEVQDLKCIIKGLENQIELITKSIRNKYA
jgi:predicted  nucleic acid-binding Zn-ribbon protein